MRTLLVFPPQAHPTQPALCLPALTAWLRAQGFEDTHQRDLNLEAHEYFLGAERLARSRDAVATAFAEQPTDRPLSLAEMDRYRVVTEAHASADAVVTGIDGAMARIRDSQQFYDYDAYLQAVKTVDRAFRLVSAEHYPASWTAHNYSLEYSIEREDEILAAIGDEEGNFFTEYLREVALPQILELNPKLLGISLTYTSQVIPGLTLAALVKAARPDIHITVGGGLLAYIGEKMTRSGRIFDAVDSVILLEGEGPLLELARCLDEGRSIDSVPNCIWRRDGEVITNEGASPLDIDQLPTPEFDGLPMDRYLAPQLALPLAITRGCYWEKCAFCTLYKVIGPGYRQRDLDKILDDIETITQKWNSNVVYFIVEDMPPVLFKKLPPALKERGIDIRWWTDARLERNLFTPELCRDLHESGCRRIAFGFESASQRLLDLMEKGTDLEEADRIVRNLHDAGISITLYTMIGFPTETVDEARATLEWLREHRDVIHEVSLRIFYIDHLSKVFAKPEDYDVREILLDPERDLQVYADWIPGSGMSRKEARELFFEFMKSIREDFPLFHGDNLLLFELKSHYFLYLCHYGDLGFLRGKSSVEVAETVPQDLRAARPQMPVGNRLLHLPYDLQSIADALNEAECSVLRPRYMSGSFKGSMLQELDGSVPAATPNATRVLFRARSGDLMHLGKDAAAVLQSFDGRRTVAEVLQGYPEALRPKLEKFVAALFQQGMLTVGARAAAVGQPEPKGPAVVGDSLKVGERLEAPRARDAETMHLYCKPGVGG